MKALSISLLAAILIHGSYGQTYDVSVEQKASHSNWETAWGTVYVAQNGLVTLAAVPNLGGRVMQYDLGEHGSIYVSDNLIGSMPDDGNVLVGGFRMLPSPQIDFGWPSPPEVDLNPYTCEIRANTADSAVIYLESDVVDNEIQKYQTHQGLQFKRLLTLYKASTRVKVEMTMINTGSTSMEHGIWDITQCVCSNNGAADLENIWVYFKKNESSSMTDGYVEYSDQADGSGEEKAQWNPDAAEGGIMGVQFLQKVGKIGADCNAGWIAHVDQLDGYAYVKTFTYEDGKTYPDGGASVQVYTYSTSAPTVEVEVLGPITTLGQNDSVKMVENWYLARSTGPVLNVTGAGLVTSKLTAEQTDNLMTIQGTFGVFYPGTVRAVFMDASSSAVAVADTFEVSPLDSLRIEQQYEVPTGATWLSLHLFNSAGELVDYLDSVAVPGSVGLNGKGGSVDERTGFSLVSLSRNGGFAIDIKQRGHFLFSLYTIDGREVVSFTGDRPQHHTVELPLVSSGLLIAQLKTTDGTVRRKVCQPR
jgi:hypothetical protein